MKLTLRIHLGSLIGGLCTLWVVFLSMPLLWVPRGTAIRPMGMAAVIVVSAMFSFVVGMPLTFWQRRRFSTPWTVLGVALSLLPFLFYIVGWNIIAALRGFEFSP